MLTRAAFDLNRLIVTIDVAQAHRLGGGQCEDHDVTLDTRKLRIETARRDQLRLSRI